MKSGWHDHNDRKKKKSIGLIISTASLTGGAAAAYSGHDYLFSVAFGLIVGIAIGVGYNLFARTNGSWPVLNIFDVSSWLFIW